MDLSVYKISLNNEKNYSEFSEGGYEQSYFSLAIKDYINDFSFDGYLGENSADKTEKFNQYYQNILNECISDKPLFFNNISSCFRQINLRSFSDIEYIDTNSDKTISVEEYMFELRKAVKKLYSNYEHNIYVNDENFRSYLETFLDISKNIVFNSENYNLYSKQFRNSDLVNNLNCIGRIPDNRYKYKKEGYSYFSMYNPFAYDSIRRILLNINDNYKKLYATPQLNDLRKEMFVKQAERAFNRFTSYNNGVSFRVALNRHNSELISSPYNKLSSIEEIKPIRLFEKIVVYINQILKNYTSSEYIDVKVCIIGHTEASNKGKELELADLLNSIITWYNRSYTIENQEYPKLKLEINNIVSDGDTPISEKGERVESIDYVENGNTGTCIIQKTDYIKEFFFTTTTLKNICEENDIIFILDCPWLTHENYDIKNNGSLNYFCEYIQKKDIENEKTPWFGFGSSERTIMQDIDTQYNRITSSDTSKSGEIARMFKDNLIKQVEAFICSHNKPEDKQKEAYIFTSEKDGVDYSYIASYALTRVERYEGKNITIVRFCNKYSEMLSIADTDIEFSIRLWSLFKYVSIAYAMIDFKKKINECFENRIVNLENYFEIFRDIVIKFRVDSNLRNISVCLGFSNRLSILAKELGIDRRCLDRIKSNLYETIIPLIRTLCYEVVFSDNNNFGDDSIRTAFEMNVYSAIKNVKTMLFWHKYRMANISKETNQFFVKVEDYYEYDLKDSNFEKESFMDKRLYSALLYVFENTDRLGIGTIALLRKSDKMFGRNNMDIRIVENILYTCELMDQTDTELYQNANEALEEILS